MYTELKNYIAADATLSGLSDPQAIADAINARTETAIGPVSISQVLIWMTSNALLIPIQAVAANSASPLQNAAAGLLLACSGGLPSLDLSNAAIEGMLAGFVGFSVVTQAQADQLKALGTTTTSIVQKLFGVPYLTDQDILAARAA